MKSLLAVFTLALGTVAFAADAGRQDSLYARMGGEKAVHAVVDEFVGRVLADSHVNKWFEHVSKNPHEAAEYKKNLADFVCKAAGGNCVYHGKDMIAAHHDMHVTADAFAAVVKHLEETLDHLKVHDAEKHELMTMVGGLKSSVVQH